MPRLQDLLFGVFGATLVVLLSFHLRIAVFALFGAFACGSCYVFTGMLPPRDEGFLRRTFTSVFLALVLASVVLILPGTLGLHGHKLMVEKAVIVIAGALPLIAIGFEIVRTPDLLGTIRRYLTHR